MRDSDEHYQFDQSAVVYFFSVQYFPGVFKCNSFFAMSRPSCSANKQLSAIRGNTSMDSAHSLRRQRELFILPLSSNFEGFRKSVSKELRSGRLCVGTKKWWCSKGKMRKVLRYQFFANFMTLLFLRRELGLYSLQRKTAKEFRRRKHQKQNKKYFFNA